MGRLYIIGLGLDLTHLGLGALEAIRRADSVYVELYTSRPSPHLVEFIKRVRPDARELTRRDLEELNGEVIFEDLRRGLNTALLVPGDPMIATTHAALAIKARRLGFEVVVINSTSIVCAAISQCGLSPYKLGPIATITYPRLEVYSTRPLEVLIDNLKRGLHTLFLLDVKEDGGLMSVYEAMEVLREVEARMRVDVLKGLAVIYAARIGWESQVIRVSDANHVPDIGEPPHVIIIPGSLNPIEEEYLTYVLNADLDLIRRHKDRVREFSMSREVY